MSLKILLTLVAVTLVAHTVYVERHRLKFVIKVWSRFRPLMFLECLGISVLTVFVFKVLASKVTVLKYGWLHLFFEKGGNLLLSPMIYAAEGQTNWLISLPFLFFFLLLVAIPFLAHEEEKLFRKGRHKWRRMVKASLIFGPVHCLVGVPVAAGIALIVPGFFFAIKYRNAYLRELGVRGRFQAQKEALMVSTTYHSMYNLILIGLLFIIVILG